MSTQSVRHEEICRRDHNPASDCGDVGVNTQCTFSGQHPAHAHGELYVPGDNASPCGASPCPSTSNDTKITPSSPAATSRDDQPSGTGRLRTRRNLLAGAAALALAPVLGTATAASSKIRQQIVYPERSLSLNNVHTGENERVVYWADGTYQTEGLNRINWILRDFRTSETKTIDPRLLNILYLLTRTLDVDNPILVLSGYRSKKTNDMLRRTTEGVARRSFHMAGRAIDIRMPAVPTQHVQRAALQLGGGGVGYYPSSNFVHLDSGPVRTW
jgi:uncharacterized protein YcbK (DUF882 family)